METWNIDKSALSALKLPEGVLYAKFSENVCKKQSKLPSWQLKEIVASLKEFGSILKSDCETQADIVAHASNLKLDCLPKIHFYSATINIPE